MCPVVLVGHLNCTAWQYRPLYTKQPAHINRTRSITAAVLWRRDTQMVLVACFSPPHRHALPHCFLPAAAAAFVVLHWLLNSRGNRLALRRGIWCKNVSLQRQAALTVFYVVFLDVCDAGRFLFGVVYMFTCDVALSVFHWLCLLQWRCWYGEIAQFLPLQVSDFQWTLFEIVEMLGFLDIA